MSGGDPDLGGQDHGRVDADHVLAGRHHVAPPLALEVLLELDTEGPVVPGGALAAVDLTAGEYEATALAQADDGVDLVGGHGALFITTTGDEATAALRRSETLQSECFRVPAGAPSQSNRCRSGRLLTTVSMFDENDCHERTTTAHIRSGPDGRHGTRPRHAHRLLRRQRGGGRHGEVRRRRVLLSDGLPRRADRREPRPRHQSHPARPGAARPGDQRPADRAPGAVRRRPLPQGAAAVRRRGGRPVRDRHQDRRCLPDHPGGARQRGRRPRGRPRRPPGRGERRQGPARMARPVRYAQIAEASARPSRRATRRTRRTTGRTPPPWSGSSTR